MSSIRSIVKHKKILAVALIVAVVVAAVVLKLVKHDKSVVQKSEPTITYSTDSPDESKKNAAKYNWQGKADEPKKLLLKNLV